MHFTLRVSLLAALVTNLGIIDCQAQSYYSPLEQEQQHIEHERKRIFDPNHPDFKRKAGLPADALIEKEQRKVELQRKEIFGSNQLEHKQLKNSFPSINTPKRSDIDIDALARRYEQKAQDKKTEEVMVFVSFTMPTASLKRIVKEANKIGASVIFRGFKNNSYKETILAIKSLGEVAGNVVVNPNAFTKYQIKSVPVLVLAKATTLDQLDTSGCALPDTYAAVSGDVSLPYALEAIAKQDRAFESLAHQYLQQLGGQS
jgi:conjugal transfer pilus assembly protein TrbC